MPSCAVLIAAGVLLLLLIGGALSAERIRYNRRIERELLGSEERAQAERRRGGEDIERFFSLSLDLLCIASADGFFKQINPAWKDVLGYENDELLGQPFTSFIHPDDLESTAAEVVKLSGGAVSIAFENRYRCKDGSYRWLIWKVAAVPDQGLLYAVASDITDRRQVEQSSARLAAIVDSSTAQALRDTTERQQIARDVAAARDQALEASRLKSAFLATMSDEIRTPMNGVIGLTGLLLRGDLEDTQRRYVDGIRVAGSALLAVINDILDFSKIEAGALVLDDIGFNLNAVLEDVVDLVSETARGKGVELRSFCDPSLPTQLRGDPVRIRQILLNLASNAVKFTDQGEVFVHLRPESVPSRRHKDPVTGADKVGVRFEVSDTGIGIDPAHHGLLFDPFAQADSSTTRRFGGTGLGLAICRELVEAMGGQIGVESRPGEGSTFWCTIPFRADTKARQAPALPNLGRLLLVEDNEINQMVATGILTGLGYGVDVANDGLEALEMVARGTYRAVLMDCQMPNMDGYEATGELRRRERVAEEMDHVDYASLPRRMPGRIPIIAMTAAALAEDRDRCLAAGMDDYLTKPIQPDELAATLIHWTTGTGAQTLGLPTQAVSTESAILKRLDELGEHCAEGLVSRLVTSFLRRAPGYLAELGDTLDRDDMDAFAHAAHSLNGAAGNLGATTMSTLCEGLETLGRDRQPQSVPDILDRLHVEYDAVRRILEGVAL